jgi:hypothetical protein
MKDLSINEWLRRLNMQQYAPKFRKEGGVKRVIDLKYIEEPDLIAFGITLLTDRKRVMDMLKGVDTAKALFALQTKSKARIIVTIFLQD